MIYKCLLHSQREDIIVNGTSSRWIPFLYGIALEEEGSYDGTGHRLRINGE